ncbi:MAG: ABC transporter substrate-binding protein [Lachnospiraceae bacterium]|nr:ABC transporter substrate-binding protein [Lachnospiraceae bacterium]
MKKKVLSMLLAAAMTLSLTACGGNDSSSAGESTVSASNEEQSSSKEAAESGGKTVNVGLYGTVTDVSPYKAPDVVGYPIQFTMYETLFVTPSVSSQETVSVVGKSWEWIDDVTASVEIYDNVHDVDGNPITAEDVVFDYETQKAAATQTDTAYIDSITATGDYTLEIKLTEANESVMVKLLTHVNIVNKGAYEADPETTPGTSAYKLTSYTGGSEYVYEKTGNYWQSEDLTAYSSKANVDKIVFQCIPEKTQMTIALETGEIQMAIGVDGLEASRFEAGGENEDGFAVDSNSGSFSNTFILNCTDDSLCSDENLRKAILYAIDRQAIVDIVLSGAGVVAKDLASDQLGGFNPEWLNEDYYTYDVAKAAEYLSKSNYNGETLRIESESGWSSILELIQAQLGAAGITVEIQTFENALWQEEKVAGTGESNWDMCVDGVGGSLVTNAWKVKFNPDNFSTKLPQNGTTDTELVDLLLKAADTQDAADIDAFHDYVVEKAYAIGLYAPADKCVTVDTISDICYNHMGYVVPGASNFDQY